MLEIHLLVIIALIIISNDSLKVSDLATATSDNVGERTTNAEGVFSLCAGDRLLVIVSWIFYPVMYFGFRDLHKGLCAYLHWEKGTSNHDAFDCSGVPENVKVNEVKSIKS